MVMPGSLRALDLHCIPVGFLAAPADAPRFVSTAMASSAASSSTAMTITATTVPLLPSSSPSDPLEPDRSESAPADDGGGVVGGVGSGIGLGVGGGVSPGATREAIRAVHDVDRAATACVASTPFERTPATVA